ncbi:MAG: GlxA family transcriptional regulator [Cohaesibacter sp.]|nr:GlxA family transcriptional regulator [Cohaesibacter sp.]MCV6602348.1 GlxA family transcriptional regulator [Cohaesibacter sp.]
MAVGETRFKTRSAIDDKPQKVAFIILERFSMIALSSAIDPLRLANRVLGRELFEWELYSLDGNPVCSSNEIEVAVNASLDTLDSADLVFVVTGIDVERIELSPLLGQKLRGLAARGAILGSLCTAAYLLAKYNLLNGYRCTIHWENLRSFKEEFPEIEVSDDIFEIDRKRMTCAGGTAALDMMLMYIATFESVSLAQEIAEVTLHQQIRTGEETQRYDLENRLGVNNRNVLATIAAMNDHIEDPLSCQQLAMMMNISSRQLERLFRKYFDTTPGQYYLRLRLEAARDLLRRTNRAILDVAVVCGFTSTSHFTKCYREHFGHTPTKERQNFFWSPGNKNTKSNKVALPD